MQVEKLKIPRDLETGLVQIEAQMKRDKKQIISIQRTAKNWIVICRSK